MRRPPTWSLLVLLAACQARISDAPSDASDPITVDDGGRAIDAPADAAPLGPWGMPQKIMVAATGASEDDVTLSSNALELVFAITQDVTTGGKDLFYASRGALDQPWGGIQRMPFSGGGASEETPRFSLDDKTLYFATDRAGNGTLDIYSVGRPAAGSTDWALPAHAIGQAVNTSTQIEKWFSPCADGHYVVVQSAGQTTHLFEGTLGNGAPQPINVLNSGETETGAYLTPDCLTVYFASTRTMPEKIYRSHRDAVAAPWQPPSVVTDFPIPGGNGNQEDPWISNDGRIFVFASDAAGTKDIYISTR
jgi:WD40-like Beta Propeller Repeat